MLVNTHATGTRACTTHSRNTCATRARAQPVQFLDWLEAHLLSYYNFKPKNKLGIDFVIDPEPKWVSKRCAHSAGTDCRCGNNDDPGMDLRTHRGKDSRRFSAEDHGGNCVEVDSVGAPGADSGAQCGRSHFFHCKFRVVGVDQPQQNKSGQLGDFVHVGASSYGWKGDAILV